MECTGTGVPSAFSLSHSYPNPFNSSTVMRFALPTSARAKLTVYNLAGQRTVTLVDGLREAGTHAVRWDGRDDHGHPVASGVYIYRLRAGDRVQARKAAVVR